MKSHIKIYESKRIAIKADGTKLPVVDSKFTFLVTPNEQDIKYGVPGDHGSCMYCLACKRMHGSDLVWVTRSLAYMELRNKDGKPELHRFILTNPAKNKIRDFDALRQVPPHSVIFAAPSGGHTLERQAKAQTAYLKRIRAGHIPKKQAYVIGSKKNERPYRSVEAAMLRDVATGLFQFKTSQHRKASIPF